MKKQTIKMLVVLTSSLLASLLIPVIGRWYEQQTGIYPIGFYILSGVVGFFVIIDVVDNKANL
jgi:hypothetical protein